jgi:ABC-2 type transport system ATP-binding protein
MKTIVRTQELGRWYGQVVGLNELSVDIEPGITGLLGPNGAGKSTFLKLIAGELRPSRGRVEVLGLAPFANRKLYRRMGFCPQQDALYEDLTGFDFVTLLLRLHGYPRREARQRAKRALERCGLAQGMERKCGGYSKGMRQRVRLAQAIAHDPELIIADEPLNGLDPVGRRQTLDLFRQLGDAGVHILVSSHVLHEVEELTEDVLLLHRGRLLAQGKVADIRRLLNQHPRKVEIHAHEARALATAILSFDDVTSVRLGPENDRLEVETRDVSRFFRQFTSVAAGRAAGIQSLQSTDESLEAVFDYLVA